MLLKLSASDRLHTDNNLSTRNKKNKCNLFVKIIKQINWIEAQSLAPLSIFDTLPRFFELVLSQIICKYVGKQDFLSLYGNTVQLSFFPPLPPLLPLLPLLPLPARTDKFFNQAYCPIWDISTFSYNNPSDSANLRKRGRHWR